MTKDNQNTDRKPTGWHTSDRSEHVVHMPQIVPFKVPGGYDYLRKGKVKSLLYFFFRQAADIVLTIYNGLMFGLRIRGRRNLRDVHGAVVVCNHVHILDCSFIDIVFRFKRMYYVTLEANFRIPVARHFIRWFGGIPIPSGIRELKEFYAAVTAAIEDGSYVCIYPEAILNPYCPTLREFNDGAFKIAAAADCPVIPLAVTFRKPWGIRRLFKRKPFVTLNILPAVYPNGDSESRNARQVNLTDRQRRREASEYMRDQCIKEMQEAISGDCGTKLKIQG